MRSGEEYRRALRDGRQVWILGEGRIDDVTTHPLTAPMVEVYVDWYDRHQDPSWQDILLTDPADGVRRPIAFEIPRTSNDLRRLGHAISAVAFLSAGNVTHTPGYGALIALGIADAVASIGMAQERVAAANAYRDLVARTGRFITFSSGNAPVGDRFRGDNEKIGVRVVRETDAGVVVAGMAGMHTSVPFAEDVFVSAGTSPDVSKRIWFAVAVNAPGVRVIARKAVAHHNGAFKAPLSSRYDELDAQLWLDDVLIPWERVFAINFDPGEGIGERRHDRIVPWLLWHQQIGWLARAEFTLGVALALSEVMGLRQNPGVVNQLVDLVIAVQTIRSCVTAAELDPEVTEAGHLLPRMLHLAPASIHTLNVRQRISEILRNMPGSSLVVAPTDRDLDDPTLAAGLEVAFGGGGYTARQRAALLHLAWDLVSSELDGRESTFELHANGGIPVWRGRIQRWFDRYDELANGVLSAIDTDLPPLDLSSLRNVSR
jgi:4-hydroxyphenylacetate 3-monooxygenase